jgi:predicted DsbA family dithiol-disulfide isomerase
MVKLDIISDPVCPWCYVGKANLDRALEKAGDHPFIVEWHPFQLNPDMPEAGMARRAYLAAKFGGMDSVNAAEKRISQMASDAGVKIDWLGVPHVPNTLDAHRLIHWAGLEARQTAAVSALFKAYWVERRNIGDHTVLAEIAESIGMDRAVTERLLASDADRDDIIKRDQWAREHGVSGVPTFVVANQHVLTGAQPPDLWGRVIADVTAQLAKAE